jgi:hypothetical protein
MVFDEDASINSLTPGTLVDGARMYAAAADAVNDKYPNASHILSHLLGMSIELTLKAYLRHQGYSETKLKSLGHDLFKLFSEAETFGFYRTGSRRFVLAVLGVSYKTRLFAYPQAGVMETILPQRLRQIADELLGEVFREIKGNDLYETMRAKPGLYIASNYPDDVVPSGWAEAGIPNESKTPYNKNAT